MRSRGAAILSRPPRLDRRGRQTELLDACFDPHASGRPGPPGEMQLEIGEGQTGPPEGTITVLGSSETLTFTLSR